MQRKFIQKTLSIPLSGRAHAIVLPFLKYCLLSVVLWGMANPVSAQTYCIPAGLSNIYYITDVTTTGGTTNISNTGTNYTTGYADYTTMTVTALQGNSFTLSATGYLFTYKWAVWVDWNSDGDFDDTGEDVYSFLSTTGVISTSAVITVPSSATAGAKRMRVRNLRDWVTDPLTACTSLNGEAEDYTLMVTASSCSGAPNAGTANAAATTIPCNTTTTLGLSGNTSGTGITYQWQYNTGGPWVNFGTNAATQTTPTVSQATQFRCRVTCTNPGGSSADGTPVTVSVVPIPVNIGNDTTICPGVTYTLNAGSAGATYAWNTGATTQTINVTTGGTYSVLVTLANGCSGSDARIITPGIVPVNVLPAITNLCDGETTNLNAGNTGSSFNWTPGAATTQTINVTAAGTYTARIRSIHGCVINSSTNVIIRPLPVASLGNDTSICPGHQIPLNAGNPGYAYLWNTSATTQAIQAGDSGTYSVTITSPYNCTLTDAIHISWLPAPYVEGFNFVPAFYEELGKVKFSPLNPSYVNSYEWDFGDGSPVSTQVEPVHTYAFVGNFLVKLKVFNGCGTFTTELPINVGVTGIESLGKRTADVSLYPNPSRDYVMVENANNDIKMERVMVFNILGALVYDHKADNAQKHKLPVTSLTSGMYTVRIQTGDGFIIRKFEVVK